MKQKWSFDKEKQYRAVKWFLMCFLVLGSTFFTACGQNRVDGERQNPTEELVIYTQHPTEFVIPLVREFEYRTGIEVTVVQGGSGSLIQKIQEEGEEQKADILFGGSLYTMKPYSGLFENYQTVNEPFVQEEFKNTEGNLIRFTDVPSVLMVNTDLMGEKEIEGYEDLLNPQLKGKIAFADPNTSSSSLEQLINILYAFRTEEGDLEEGWRFVEALLLQMDGKLLPSSSAVYNGVADGKYMVGLTFEEAAAGLKEDGKHIRIVYMKEGVVSTPDGVYLLKNAPHEEQAKQFLDFVTGYDAQYMITRQLNRRSVRKDIMAPPNLESKSEIPMLSTDADYVEANRSVWLETFNELWEKYKHE